MNQVVKGQACENAKGKMKLDALKGEMLCLDVSPFPVLSSEIPGSGHNQKT